MSDTARCRLCGGRHLSHLLSLNDLPISHYLRKSPQDPDPRFTVGFDSCEDCGLLQIVHAIPAELIYSEADTYTTGFQRPRHLDDLITTAVARQDPGKAIDVGCNDGALMEHLRRAGYTKVVGLEPNSVAADIARKKGHEVYTGYLTEEEAGRIVAKHGAFDTLFLRHVVEHVPDLEGFFAGVRALLRDDGLLVIELPDVEESFALGSPAILWEEHVNYFTRAQAEHMLRRFGFQVCDRRNYVFGGGSMAFVAQKKAAPAACALTVPDPARTADLLHRFAAGIERQKAELSGLVASARSAGYQVLLYGAAPRSCLLVTVCQIADKIDFVVDDRQDIQNRLMPGTSHVVRPLSDVAGAAGGKLICLLGVGSENEFKVRKRVEETVEASTVHVSLFPPRDILKSIAEAHRAITASQNKDRFRMSRIDLPPQPNGYKVQWSYLPKQFSAGNIEEILDLFRKFVPTGDFTLGKPVAEFEGKFAAMIGTRHAIGVNSGTDAIKLGLKALGVGPGDEVITTANTFIATVGAIGELFAKPVFVDCTDNFCMDVSQVESKITKKTKAIVPVHLAGQMTNMPVLMEIARKHNLPVVEDSCQCILGNIDGKNSGTYGRSGAFSLHPLKNLNVWSDGGMIVTDDDAFATEMRQLRNHGLAGRDSVVRMGCNSRLDSIQAVVGNWLIPQVHFITDTRIKNAGYLDRELSKIPGIKLPQRFNNRKLVFHLYIVFAERRDELVAHCKKNGVEVKVHYPVPLYQQEGLRQYGYRKGDFPVTDRHAATMISFPAHEHLTEEQLAYTVQTVKEFYGA